MATGNLPEGVHNYVVRVSMSVERQTSQYSTDKLANVQVDETVTLTESQVAVVFDDAVSECGRRAATQLGIRQAAEMTQRQIEAGTVEVS